MAYIPTPGPLPGEQWKPSNSDDGYGFIGSWCANCAKDKAAREGAPVEECDDNELCEIVAASFRGEAVEWRRLPTGQTTCIAFLEAGSEMPAPRCPYTVDMFDAGL